MIPLKAKNQNIYKSVQELFQSAFQLQDCGKLRKFLKFVQRMPSHAPFNTALVFLQNPQSSYYATANQWEKYFRRTAKLGSRPMVILFPFGPVQFVYDIEDTEGEPVSNENFLYWWKEEKVYFNEKVFTRTCNRLGKYHIEIKEEQAQTYFQKTTIHTAGLIRKESGIDGRSAIIFHPRYRGDNGAEVYGVLCHEIAHRFLGHLGHVDEWNNKLQAKKVYEDRSDIPLHLQELEAEVTAWLVFNGFGIKKRSAEYLASWLTDQKDIEKVDMVLVLRVANHILRLGR